MRIFISRMSALGDVICTLPTACALKRGMPDCEIVWGVDRRFAGIPPLCSSIDQVWTVPKKLSEAREEGRKLGHFDISLDMQGLLKSAIATRCVSADRRLGCHWQREGAGLFSQKVLPDPTSLHIIDQNVDVARAVGGEGDRAEFNLKPAEKDVEAVRSRLVDVGVDLNKPMVLFNGGAGWVTKRWAPENFVYTANAVTEAGGCAVFLGAPNETVIWDELVEAGLSRAHSMIGKTNIPELVALVDQCTAHVAGDTGSTHIAAALDKPAFGVYMLTRPERTGPYGQRHRCLTLDKKELTEQLLSEVFA
jgi:ADP-heptose:LPS heptosyltransferase